MKVYVRKWKPDYRSWTELGEQEVGAFDAWKLPVGTKFDRMYLHAGKADVLVVYVEEVEG